MKMKTGSSIRDCSSSACLPALFSRKVKNPSVQPAQAAPTASVAKSSAGEAPAWQKSAKPPVATNPAEPQGADSDLIQVSGKVVETHEAAAAIPISWWKRTAKQTWVARAADRGEHW